MENVTIEGLMEKRQWAYVQIGVKNGDAWVISSSVSGKLYPSGNPNVVNLENPDSGRMTFEKRLITKIQPSMCSGYRIDVQLHV